MIILKLNNNNNSRICNLKEFNIEFNVENLHIEMISRQVQFLVRRIKFFKNFSCPKN